MLTLALRLPEKGGNVSVSANGAESHAFRLDDLAFTRELAATFSADPSCYGNLLFNALFKPASTAGKALADLLPGSRLILQMQGETLNGLPWEYLHNGKNYLATEYALARCAPGSGAILDNQIPERLRFLFAPSDPLLHGAEAAPYRLGIDQEWDDLLKDLQSCDAGVDLVKIQPPTFAELQNQAAGMKSGMLHFTGHGAWEKDKAYLLFEQPSGASDLVEAAHFAALVRGKVALVVLSACQSATPGQSLEANLAGLLSAQGIPFVLGMQLSVPERSARVFTDMFYRYLFAGEDVYEAVRQARLAVLKSHSALEMGIPVLYAVDPSQAGILKPGGNGLSYNAPPRPKLDDLPSAESGFFGRQRELAQVGSC